MREWRIVVSYHNFECHYGRCVSILFQSDHHGTLSEDPDQSEGDYIARRKAFVSLSIHLLFVFRRLTAHVQSLYSHNRASRVSRTELEEGRPDKSYDEARYTAAGRYESFHSDRSYN